MNARGRLALAAAFLVLVALLSGALGYISKRPANQVTTATGTAAATAIRGVVQQVSGDTLTLTTDAGPLQLRLTPSSSIEVLRSVGTDAIRPGDWLNAGAVPHNQTVFALLYLVFIPQERLTPP